MFRVAISRVSEISICSKSIGIFNLDLEPPKWLLPNETPLPINTSTDANTGAETEDCTYRWVSVNPGTLSELMKNQGQYIEKEISKERVVRVGFLNKPKEAEPFRFTKLRVKLILHLLII